MNYYESLISIWTRNIFSNNIALLKIRIRKVIKRYLKLDFNSFHISRILFFLPVFIYLYYFFQHMKKQELRNDTEILSRGRSLGNWSENLICTLGNSGTFSANSIRIQRPLISRRNCVNTTPSRVPSFSLFPPRKIHPLYFYTVPLFCTQKLP